jgi:hypothetical protein
MEYLLRSDTLRVKGLFGRTFWLTLLLLLLVGGIGESIARLEIFQLYLTPPRLVSRHFQLGYKLVLLDAAQKNGSIDCIAVGSSIIDVGFDPAAFHQGYREITGQDIKCFNFGIDAASSISTAALAKILIEDYHPRILIFGTDARDYAVRREDRDTAVVLDTPWVKYRMGEFSPEGWLLDHSYLYRYRKQLSRLARLELDGALWSHTKGYELRSDGYNPIRRVSTYINNRPNPTDDSFEFLYYNRIYSSYEMLDENLIALEQIMSYQRIRTNVIVVEMPVSDGLYYFFGNGAKDYNRFVAEVEKAAGRHQILFWRTEPLDFIPDNGWMDYSHLNTTGAEIFSIWLGEEVGIAEVQGSLMMFRP